MLLSPSSILAITFSFLVILAHILPKGTGSVNRKHANSHIDCVQILGFRLRFCRFVNRTQDLFQEAMECLSTDIDLPTLEKLRARCVKDVMRTHGQISFKDILKFQKEL